MNNQIQISQSQKIENSITLFRYMTTTYTTERVRTPYFAEFIEVLASTFDQKPDDNKNTRSDALSTSRSMRGRQLIYQQIIPRLFSVMKIKEERHKAIRTIFLKIENILSHLNSIPLCSTCPRDFGDAVFFKDVSLPQIIEILRFLSATETDGIWLELHNYITDLVAGSKSLRDCIARLKNEIRYLLEPLQVSDFKGQIDKLDSRSFPTLKQIEKLLEQLHNVIADGSRKTAIADDLVAKLRYKFLAAKASFYALKYIAGNQYSQPFLSDKNLLEAHKQLCADYICNRQADGLKPTVSIDFDFLEYPSFNLIKSHFLNRISNIAPEDIPNAASRTPLGLLDYKNGALLPWCAHQKFIWDLKKGNINKSYITNFEEMLISTSKKYQYGNFGFTIATLLIGTKIKTNDSIPHQSLEPLAMMVLNNSAISNTINFEFSTPFGISQPTIREKPEFTIICAVGLFNRTIKEEDLNLEICNPFENLEKILKSVLTWKHDEQDGYFHRPSILEKRPIKYASLKLYETLKNLNELLFMHGLAEIAKFDADNATYVEESLAGQYINAYLALSNTEKREILRKISQEEYTADMKRAQSPT